MDLLRIRGARTHNLQNLDLDLPRNALIVITGLSGSGKSSLAFDTLYAEGQRRYVESLSAYARQFLSMMEKPDVDHIEGLSPAIAIEQKSTSHNPRSTVGTITEIYDYLRLLYARAGTPRCPDHGIELNAQTVSQMVDQVLARPEGTRLMLLAPVIQERKGEHLRLLEELRRQGFIRARIDGEVVELDAPPALDLRRRHTIEVVVDRFKVRPDLGLRLAESFETALRLANGVVRVAFMDQPEQAQLLFSAGFACPVCGYSLSGLEPRLFSFNNPLGACPDCDGLGVRQIESVLVQDEPAKRPSTQPCPACHGTRLNRAARHVYLAGTSLPQITALPVGEALAFFAALDLPGRRGEIAAKIVREIGERLSFLANVGLDYLTLDRSADTLSGGETQRIRLASQIGAGLVGVMYVLDEPSIGLHQRDNARLLKALLRLRDLGNTVIVVEHDQEAILAADHVVDIGPGAGAHGGRVIAQGSPAAVMASAASLTGQYLAGRRRIVPAARRR
nr:ABC-ATPase UvrA [Pseudomonadota bacterium]